MSGNDGRPPDGELAFDDVKIGTADSAGGNFDEHFVSTRLRPRHLVENERPLLDRPGFSQQPCLHLFAALLQKFCDEARPACLMAGAESHAVVAVKVLVEHDV